MEVATGSEEEGEAGGDAPLPPPDGPPVAEVPPPPRPQPSAPPPRPRAKPASFVDLVELSDSESGCSTPPLFDGLLSDVAAPTQTREAAPTPCDSPPSPSSPTPSVASAAASSSSSAAAAALASPKDSSAAAPAPPRAPTPSGEAEAEAEAEAESSLDELLLPEPPAGPANGKSAPAGRAGLKSRWRPDSPPPLDPTLEALKQARALLWEEDSGLASAATWEKLKALSRLTGVLQDCVGGYLGPGGRQRCLAAVAREMAQLEEGPPPPGRAKRPRRT